MLTEFCIIIIKTIMNKKILLITLFISLIVNAQDKGNVTGLLTDKEYNNAPLPFANVQLKGTTIGTTTDFDGMYTLSLDPGNYIIVFSFLGYKTIEKPFIILPGKTITINQLMSAEEGVALEEVIVKSSTSKEKVSALIFEQKKAISIIQKLNKLGILKSQQPLMVSNLAERMVKTAKTNSKEKVNTYLPKEIFN